MYLCVCASMNVCKYVSMYICSIFRRSRLCYTESIITWTCNRRTESDCDVCCWLYSNLLRFLDSEKSADLIHLSVNTGEHQQESDREYVHVYSDQHSYTQI